MNELNGMKVAMTAFLGGLTALWGWLGWLFVCWAALMLLDYITGSAAAAKRGEWSSKVARDGIWHKLGMAVVVMVAGVADLLFQLLLEQLPVLELPICFAGLLCPLVLVWYCITELGSITENAVAMGASVPGWLQKVLAVSRQAMEQKAGELTGQDGGEE